MAEPSFRTNLRAFQSMRGKEPDSGFVMDLEFLENRDLDLSVRLGAMLAFNALMVTIGTHPISASPGAPLSFDAATQPVLTLASLCGLAPLAVSCVYALRAMMLGEDFTASGMQDDAALRRKLFAAFIRSIDVQTRLLRRSVRWTLGGAAATCAVWALILADKML